MLTSTGRQAPQQLSILYVPILLFTKKILFCDLHKPFFLDLHTLLENGIPGATKQYLFGCETKFFVLHYVFFQKVSIALSSS